MSVSADEFPDLVVVRVEAAPESKPEPGLTRKVMAHNDKLFLAEHQMVKGWVGSVHSHPHDQVVYVVRGHLKVTCQGETFEIRSGDNCRRHDSSYRLECKHGVFQRCKFNPVTRPIVLARTKHARGNPN